MAAIPDKSTILFSYLRAGLSSTYSDLWRSVNGVDEDVAIGKEVCVVRDLVNSEVRADVGGFLRLHCGQHCLKGRISPHCFRGDRSGELKEREVTHSLERCYISVTINFLTTGDLRQSYNYKDSECQVFHGRVLCHILSWLTISRDIIATSQEMRLEEECVDMLLPKE